ncbi:DUF1315 domain-containing protein [Psychromonas sp. psych-6C06]|uniref:YeaC family protein n=1 Tax=Psychromonas sp. psych-6C06 TaxID=2058089 RepID=UPI000C335554|nr:DUF1315 family protein [Psychromonas sp. psych-6C06]PKF60602.1 DUF1315 domain-containing protein [Psychromonas sp. psych-6C06]
MSNITEYAKNLSPELYQQLKQAVETGKWLDGNKLDENQKADTLQLIMAYQSLHNDKPDHFSIAKGGEIYMEKKSVLKEQFASSNNDIYQVDLE